MTWVNLAMERLAAVLPRSETQEFPKLDHFGLNQRLHKPSPEPSVPPF